MTPSERVARRRAIEALRAGVPSWSAVAALGSGQAEAEDRFLAMLASAGGASGPEQSVEQGLLIGAGFGAGKSHLLTHLGHLGVAADAAVSLVVISKETPLHDPAKVLRAAVESLASLRGRGDGVVAEAAAALDPDTTAYAALTRWVNAAASGMDERFAATLLVHERLQSREAHGAEDVMEALVQFWCGAPLRISDLKRALASVGQAGLFSFSPISVRELARQRIRFLSHLLRAAGYSGWIVLFDEVELIGRYSVLQRGRSYAEIAGWLSGGSRLDPLIAVLAITDDFEAAVLSGKNDREAVPTRLRGKQTADWDEIAAAAEVGMRHIDRDMLLLNPPGDAELDRVYTALKRLHADAFSWDPPDVAGLERLGATRMRQYVRAWINEWDLVMLDPDYTPATGVATLVTSYEEDGDL